MIIFSPLYSYPGCGDKYISGVIMRKPKVLRLKVLIEVGVLGDKAQCDVEDT